MKLPSELHISSLTISITNNNLTITFAQKKYKGSQNQYTLTIVCSIILYYTTTTVLWHTVNFVSCRIAKSVKWQTHALCMFMAQFKGDKKIICHLPLNTVHIFSEIRSHGGPSEGEGLSIAMDNMRKMLCFLKIKAC